MTSMSHIQELDRKSCFVFVGDLNAHHRDWLNSISETDPHGVAALDFANLTNCEQLIVEPTHIRGNRLDLLLTDVPGVVDASVKPPLGNSDHSVISFDLMLRSSVPNTRNVKINLPYARIDIEQQSTVYQCCSLINSLDDTFLIPQSKQRLKRLFKDHCISKY